MQILRKFDVIILLIIAIVAGILSVVNFFEPAIIANTKFYLITLFLLAMISIHLIVTHFSQEDFQKKSIDKLDKISKTITASDFRIFNDSKEIESYLGERMLEAKESVCDLSWKARISEGFSASDRQITHGYMDKCISKISDRISYREILMFNDQRRVAKLNRRLKENKKGYSCRYFDEETSIPRIQFVLIDDEEVFFFASSADSILCSVKSKDLCKVFRSYYEAIWNEAIPIKSGPQIFHDQVALIQQKFATS